MKNILRNTLLAFSILTTQSIYAFDDNREGFIISIGFGVGNINTKISADNIQIKDKKYKIETSENSIGLKTSFKLGYGFTDKFLLYYINDVNWYSYKNTSDTYVSGLTGLGFSYFFDKNNQYFISSAIGISTYANLTQNIEAYEHGYGFKAGLGYEIDSHLQLETDYTYTQANDNNTKLKTHSVNLALNYMWY